MAPGDSIVRDIEKRLILRVEKKKSKKKIERKELNKTELKNLARLNKAWERLRYNLFLNLSTSLRKSVEYDLQD